MFGFTGILSISVSLLLASQSVVAVPSPSSPSPFLFIRQSANPGQNMTTVIQACTNDVVSQYEACYDCELNALAATLEFLQKDINGRSESHVGNTHSDTQCSNGGERLSLGISGSVIVGLAALSLVVLQYCGSFGWPEVSIMFAYQFSSTYPTACNWPLGSEREERHPLILAVRDAPFQEAGISSINIVATWLITWQ
ncbi:hypothetical protein C8J57DRAFT_1373093 [Mycena rebaudengoi]|nr:hypothetical protein C8J57DRAFT_1373093 [Mycena rebaudengoi]